MKRIILIMRHAKACDFSLKGDFYRPLDSKGKSQPQKIAIQLNQLNIKIDQLLVSPSTRTKETCELLLKELKQPLIPIFEPGLYNATLDDMLMIAQTTTVKSFMIIAHNPGVSQLTEFLSGKHISYNTADLGILSSWSTEGFGYKNFSFEQMLSANE